MFDTPAHAQVVAEVLSEDLGLPADRFLAGAGVVPDVLERDVTSSSAIDEDAMFTGRVVARQDCVIAGLPIAAAVFERMSEAAGLFEPIDFFPLVAEGTHVQAGTPVAEVEGPAVAVLAAERSALNLLMTLSGIATRTAQWVAAAGPDIRVLDTRKTLPGLRELSKYAVVVGGGTNHRRGLWDMVLIKDNHIREAGGLTSAIGRARLRRPGLVIEAEADTRDQAREAVAAGADIVLLDNMDDATMAEVVASGRASAAKLGRSVQFEASGNMTLERLRGLASTGVDRVSASAITMAPPVDLALDEV